MSWIYYLIGLLPFECLEPVFMRQALLTLLLLTPMTALLGIHVLNFRMAFFSDAVGHSAFTGLALGLILGAPPQTAVLIFGVIIGFFITAIKRGSNLSADAAIGIIFSAVVAFGLAVVSNTPSLSRDIQQYLYGDILTVSEAEIVVLMALFLVLALFEICGWNRLLYLSLGSELINDSKKSAFWEYLYSGLLALVVMFCARAVGVLLITALLVVPAAAARNMGNSMAGMFWWSIVISVMSGITGLGISAQEFAPSSGATIILASFFFYALSLAYLKLKK